MWLFPSFRQCASSSPPKLTTNTHSEVRRRRRNLSANSISIFFQKSSLQQYQSGALMSCAPMKGIGGWSDDARPWKKGNDDMCCDLFYFLEMAMARGRQLENGAMKGKEVL
ncbi:long chain fatty alcohol oxidase [Sesbania bispinosa]|nr:long chain fatty alcohol oxidase [Sesbania bispinosa]